eukprot:3918221-Prymnesium_polylepis.1
MQKWITKIAKVLRSCPPLRSSMLECLEWFSRANWQLTWPFHVIYLRRPLWPFPSTFLSAHIRMRRVTPAAPEACNPPLLADATLTQRRPDV